MLTPKNTSRSFETKKLEPEAAERWYDKLVEAILSLETMPASCKIIEEQAWFAIELRQYLYHSHRIIFHLDRTARVVQVLRIYHGARDVFGPDKLPKT